MGLLCILQQDTLVRRDLQEGYFIKKACEHDGSPQYVHGVMIYKQDQTLPLSV